MNETTNHQNGVHCMHSPRSVSEVSINSQTPPIGLASLYTLCKRVYPDQCNPLQATTVIKYWYVNMYFIQLTITTYLSYNFMFKTVP